MRRGEAETPETGDQPWQTGRKAKTSILQVFRASHSDRDSHHRRQISDDGTTRLTSARKQRRFGVSEHQLRRHLEADLAALLNTIHLEATVSLDEAPHVANSILNYGFRDLSGLGRVALNTPAVVDTLRQSLIRFEPRLIAETLDVQIRDTGSGKTHHLAIFVTAELLGDPVDVPLDFDAEIDLGAGKMSLSNLRMNA